MILKEPTSLSLQRRHVGFSFLVSYESMILLHLAIEDAVLD